MAISGRQTQQLPDLVPVERINLEEFEPAVRDQLSRAYEEVRKRPQDGAVAGKLGMVLQVYGKYELAQSCYLRARGLDPGSSRWPYYLGVVEKSLGKNEQAIGHVREALKIDPGYAPARVRLAGLLFDSGDTEQSAELYRSAIAQNNRLATAYFGLGQVLAARADWPAAIEAYSRACDIAKNYAAAHYALGMAYRNAGDMAKARTHLQLSQSLKQAKQPSDDPLIDELNSLYSGGLTRFAKGSSLYQAGKLREAIVEFEGALEVNPRMVMAHINLIALYGQLNQPDKSEQHFRSAIDLDPGWVEAYFNWGMFLVQHGKPTEAAEMFRKAIEVNPDYPEAQVQLGLLLDESGSREEADAHFRRALEINPNHRPAHYFLARSLLRSGKVSEAIQHLLETTKVEDAWTPVCMQALALAYEREGNRERAVYFLRQAKQRAVSQGAHDLTSQLQRDIDRLSAEVSRP
jgi:superkiller protein 3